MAKKDTKEYDGSTMLKSVMQETFVTGIIAGLTQHEAYKQAGYSQKSVNALKANSSKLITIDNVKARLDYKRGQLAAKTELTAEIVIAKLREIAFNELKNKDIQTSHQLSALDMISKHLGLYERDNTQKQGLTLVEILARVGGSKPDNRLPGSDLTALPAAQSVEDGGKQSFEGKTDV